MDDHFAQSALEYHQYPTPGKISVTPTKGMTNQRDLALAYSPGVAIACEAIVEDPQQAYSLTSRGNLVAIVTNGTEVLGLGDIGPLAGKPVMEGKGCLFKKFAGIDVFDIELQERDPDKLVEMIAAMEPAFGGVNLEDIRAPECFYIEKKLRERMKIPVFHDDQHGTAAYRQAMERFVYRSGGVMRPVFAAAAQAPQRVIYAEGENATVLRAAQIAVDEKLARPVLVGRSEKIAAQIRAIGLRLKEERDFDLVATQDEALVDAAAEEFYSLNRRNGATRERTAATMRANPTLLAAMLLRSGKADAMLCGVHGAYAEHLEFVAAAIGLKPGARSFAAMNLLMLPQQTLFICDTYVNEDPTAEELAEIALLAVEEQKRFGVTPRVALLSHSSFGSASSASAKKMRRAFELIRARAPDLEIEGEMRGDAALSERILDRAFPGSRLNREANLLIMPSLDAANITFNVLKTVAGEGVTVGPILLGAAKPVHILTPTSTVRRIVNMTALASVEAAKQN